MDIQDEQDRKQSLGVWESRGLGVEKQRQITASRVRKNESGASRTAGVNSTSMDMMVRIKPKIQTENS